MLIRSMTMICRVSVAFDLEAENETEASNIVDLALSRAETSFLRSGTIDEIQEIIFDEE